MKKVIKTILGLVFLLNLLNSNSLLEIYNNKLCILGIDNNLHLEKQGLCPKISELSFFFKRGRNIEEIILNKPGYISDKFDNDKKIIPYFGQYFNFIDTTMYFKIKEPELDNRLLYILLKNQVIYIGDNIYMFNKLIEIEDELYLGINQFNFIKNKTSQKMFDKISENANQLVYIYDNDF